MKIIVFLLFLSPSLLFAIEAKEVLEKMNAFYSGAKRFSCNTSYELFKGHKSNDIEESYTGFLYREDKQYYQKIDQTEFVYGSDYFVKISHKEKLLVYDLAQKNAIAPVDLNLALKECSEVKLEDKSGYYLITMLFKQTSLVPLSVLKIEVYKKDFNLKQLDLYYSTHQDFSKTASKKDLQQAHLRVKFMDFTDKPAKEPSKFDLKSYITNSDHKNRPSDTYFGYKLIDNRVK